MKTGLLLLLAFATGAPVAFPASVGDAVARPMTLPSLTLERACELAVRLHPTLAEARARVEAAAGRLDQAGVFPNPEAVTRVEGAPQAGAEYLAGVAQAIPLGGRLSRAREVEEAERDRLDSELELRYRELRRRIHAAFATALYQERAHAIRERLAEDSARLLQIAQARLAAGDAAIPDRARAEMDLATARVERERSAAMLAQAMAALLAAIGDPDLSVAALEGDLDDTFALPTLESLVEGLRQHPAMAAARAEIRAGNARIDLARAGRIPDLKVELLYRRMEGSRENAFDAGVSVAIPLFDRNRGRIREARADLAAVDARARLTETELRLQLREAHARLATAVATERTLRLEILPHAEAVARAAEQRHAAGDISLAELLPVRREWASIQLGHLESVRDVMEAWAALQPHLPRD